MPVLDLEVEKQESLWVISLIGSLDKAGKGEIEADFSELVKNVKPGVFVLDCSELDFVNSEGIGYLIDANSDLAKRGKKMLMVGLKANIKDIFLAVGLLDIIPVYKNIDSILNLKK